MKKTTLASLVGVAAFAAAGVANATIVVGGENGYEFSIDGNINQFYIYNSQNNAGGDQSNSQVANGLLPAFLGFNIKAPEINGLTVGARISISPSTNGGSYFGGDNGSAMEQREAYATVDGAFGQVLLGKALGVYSANNILLDQTLFGVGATGLTAAGDQNTAETSLGRIGWGYDYANWRSQIRYTTPNMGGFQAAFAIVDADNYDINGFTRVERDPRYEASLSYATAFDGGAVKVWLDGMRQEVEYFSAATGDKSIKSHAWTLGGQLILGGFEAVASYYENQAQGIGGLGGGAFGFDGQKRDGEGYYVQAGYRFAGKTFVAGSYGQSKLDRDHSIALNPDPSVFDDLDKNEMYTIGVYHDVTANLKLVAEYSKMETEFHSGARDAKNDVFAIGGFISW